MWSSPGRPITPAPRAGSRRSSRSTRPPTWPPPAAWRSASGAPGRRRRWPCSPTCRARRAAWHARSSTPSTGSRSAAATTTWRSRGSAWTRRRSAPSATRPRPCWCGTTRTWSAGSCSRRGWVRRPGPAASWRSRRGPPRAETALRLEPPAGNPVCPGRRPVDDSAVIDWDVDHPAVAGLDGLEALTLEHAVQLVTPGWGSAVVLGATARGAFPLLVAGERDGHRLACLGADLAGPLVSSEDVALLLLVLSTLRWLEEPPGGTALLVQTGVPVLAGSGAAEFHGPGLHVAGDPPVVLAERTGVYRAR